MLADREMVESGCDAMLESAMNENVAFLVVGDPFGATTHTDLYLRAIRRGVSVNTIHNASIINAIGVCGLQLYSFGPIVTIPFFTKTWQPDSPYTKIAANFRAGQHTLCLLDIKVKEQSEENLLRGRLIYEPPRYMTVKQAVEQLLEIEERRGEGVCTKDSLGVGVMRIGGATQKIIVGTLAELMAEPEESYGGPLHSFILPARELHEMEYEMLQLNALAGSLIGRTPYSEYLKSLEASSHQ